MAYNGLYRIFMTVLMDSLQALMSVFLFAFIIFREKFIPHYLWYSLMFGSIYSLFVWIAYIFVPSADMIVNIFLMIMLYFIAFKFIFRYELLKCIACLFITIVLYIHSDMCTAVISGLINVKELLTDFNAHLVNCLITLALYSIQLLVINIFSYATKQPQPLNLRVIIAKAGLLAIPIVMIIFDIIYMYKDENKLILIANCAVLFYLIYANINSNIGVFKYKKLMDQYVATVSELSVVNERSRFARDTHDTIGHTMSRIIGVLEKCRDSYDNTEASAQMLNATVEYARDGFEELRRSIIGMIPEKLESDDLEGALKRLFSGFNALDVKIDFAVYGKFSGSLKISEAVYKICQEVLSDSILYGNTPNIRVVLRAEKKLQLSIFNEGTGCEVLKKGFGITGIEQRVRELGGQMKIIPTEGEGFHLQVIIPNINVPLQVY